MRLIQGPDQTYGRGRLEIYSEQNQEWGTVNAYKFDYQEAQVACFAMG